MQPRLLGAALQLLVISACALVVAKAPQCKLVVQDSPQVALGGGQSLAPTATSSSASPAQSSGVNATVWTPFNYGVEKVRGVNL